MPLSLEKWTLYGKLLLTLAARTWLKWMSRAFYIFLSDGISATGFGARPRENIPGASDDDMNISFWLNRYQTNKYNAARNKKFRMIYNIFETNPFIFHPFQQLNYSLGAWREKEKCTEHGTRNKSFQRNQKNWMCFFSSVKIVKNM